MLTDHFAGTMATERSSMESRLAKRVGARDQIVELSVDALIKQHERMKKASQEATESDFAAPESEESNEQSIGCFILNPTT